jgi:hypothetical protein
LAAEVPVARLRPHAADPNAQQSSCRSAAPIGASELYDARQTGFM